MSNIAYETIFAIVETHTERIDEKKKKKIIAESAMQTRIRAYFHVVRGRKRIAVYISLLILLSHLSRNAFEILFHKTEKKTRFSQRNVSRYFARRLRTIVLTINFTTSLNIFNLRPFFLISFYLSNFLRS